MGDTIDSKLAKFAAVVATWADEANSEVEEAVGILKEVSQGTNHMWWAEKLMHNMTADKGPTYDVANGDDADTLLETAFWSGWLKGEQDTLNRLMETVTKLITGIGPGGTQPGKNGNGKNDFLEGLR